MNMISSSNSLIASAYMLVHEHYVFSTYTYSTVSSKYALMLQIIVIYPFSILLHSLVMPQKLALSLLYHTRSIPHIHIYCSSINASECVVGMQAAASMDIDAPQPPAIIDSKAAQDKHVPAPVPEEPSVTALDVADEAAEQSGVGSGKMNRSKRDVAMALAGAGGAAGIALLAGIAIITVMAARRRSSNGAAETLSDTSSSFLQEGYNVD